MNFKALKDHDFLFIQDNIRLFFDGFGIYKGDFFTEWIGAIIEKWTGSKDTTFQQLYDKTGKDVFFQGTNVSTYQLRTFSRETTPDVPLVVAVRIAMSIPFFFKYFVPKQQPESVKIVSAEVLPTGTNITFERDSSGDDEEIKRQIKTIDSIILMDEKGKTYKSTLKGYSSAGNNGKTIKVKTFDVTTFDNVNHFKVLLKDADGKDIVIGLAREEKNKVYDRKRKLLIKRGLRFLTNFFPLFLINQ